MAKFIIDITSPNVRNEYIVYLTYDGLEAKRVSYLTPYTEPDLKKVRKEGYDKGYADAKGGYENGFENGYENGFANGMIVAWDAARKIGNMPYNEEEKIFGSGGWTFIEKHTASEAVEKIRQYEQEKDRQARIEYNFDEIKDVLETTAKECNVSLDEIAEVLQKMREES